MRFKSVATVVGAGFGSGYASNKSFINAFDVSPEGVVYIATQDQGIIYGTGPEMEVYDDSIDDLVNNRYIDILYDDENALWATDRQGRLLKLKNDNLPEY